MSVETMNGPLTLYSAAGSGGVAVEAALTLIGRPFEVVEAATWEQDPEVLARVKAVNPLRQVPALVLPDGEILTESAAILIWLAERHPEARLGPPPGDPRRGRFLRWMTYVAGIYGFYWVKDDPSRLAPEPSARPALVERAEARILELWRGMNDQVEPGDHILGEGPTVLDLYVAVVSRFRPRRARFYAAAPKLKPVVERVDADPRLADFWTRRYPFFEGWDR